MMAIDIGLDINIDRDTAPLPTGDFSLPLILGMSGVAPQSEYDTFSALDGVIEKYPEADHARIVNWARYMFRTGAGRVAVYNVDRTDPATEGELSTALTNISDESFFYVTTTSRDGSGDAPVGLAGDRDDVSEWCQDNNRIFLTANQVGETAADQETYLLGLSRDRTYYIAQENASQNEDNVDNPVDAGLAGRAAANFPGSINFKFQELSDLVASDYTQSELDTIASNGGNAYVQSRGINMTNGAISTDNETFIDIPVIELWLTDQLESRLLRLLVDQQKVGFDATGLVQIEDAIRGAFELGAEEDLFVIDTVEVDAPDPNELTSEDRADRVLENVTFFAQLTGAVNEINVRGTISA